MEKLGQLHADAQAHRPLGPDRGRHAAVPVGAGLPGRARAAVGLPRRPVHPAAAGPGPRPGPADDGRARHGHQRADQDPRGAGAARHADVRRPRSTPCSAGSGSGPRRPSSCSRPTVRRSWWSPRRSRTRCARRRTSWSGSRGADAARGPGGQPGQPAPRAAGCRRSRRVAAAERLERGAATTGPPPGCSGCTPSASRIVARETRLRRRFTAAHPDVPTAVVPALSTDVHDLDGLRLVGGLLSRQR